ncbi:Potassium transporter [Entomophthora muscae]|uniref:Potassium transporter n=1 Tax=Entomophthora muscae TaxID=34485 RepID=A0ACC2RJX9_9FUNG|nr:Potassium transporter [Entomophthora muscae]
MPICGIEGAKWKREVIQDHSFEYLDVREFHDPSYFGHFKYAIPFLAVLRSTLMYASDFWTGYNLAFQYETAKKLYFGNDSNSAYRIIFLISIAMSCLLLIYEVRKASRILRTRDISFTYTNIIAHRVYTLGSYHNFCFFQRISASPKFSDNVAFYVFFTLKGWKRVMFAVAPREAIKSIVIYELFRKNSFTFKYSTTISEDISVGTLVATNLLFCFALLQVVFASLLYIPLLFHIQGNLKEYCCHKIDKRISELLAKQRRKRQLQIQRAEEQGIQLKVASRFKGVPNALPKPTLPQIALDNELEEGSVYSQSSTTSTSQFVTRGIVPRSHTTSPVSRFPPSGQNRNSNSSQPPQPHVAAPNHSAKNGTPSNFRPPPNIKPNP